MEQKKGTDQKKEKMFHGASFFEFILIKLPKKRLVAACGH
jgi:hypothetical protein